MTHLGTWSTDQTAACNKLLAHKSSFQAWKCVSFGCSLLAAVLLLSKCYEVTTDLNLLLGIERLLTHQDTLKSASPSNSNESTSLSWPPVPIEVMLPAQNDSGFGMESMRDNSSMLMSHMHLSLGRELASDNLLRQEVDAFVGEFKMAKSTLSLSVMLVGVYIISWILMTLAINDTRISNDVSLRNILLLSVFGAIDVAASVGFVMVRLIMYSVKNHSFASKMVATTGLRDTPTRLSADQLTAFTALRLIGMRSCSAYVDIYVSVVMTLLTVLRLYAITRALGYYRRLRRLTDPISDLDFHQQSSDLKQQQAIWSSSYYNAAQPVAGGFLATAAAHQMISPAARRLSQPDLQRQVDADLDRSLRLVPDPYDQGSGHTNKQYYHGTLQPRDQELMNPKGSYRFQTGSVPPQSTSKLVFRDPNDIAAGADNDQLQTDRRSIIKPPRKRANINDNNNNISNKQSKTTNREQPIQQSTTTPTIKKHPQLSDASANILLVDDQYLAQASKPEPRLLQATSLTQLNGQYQYSDHETGTGAGEAKVRSYTLMRASQLDKRLATKDHRYRLVEVARFEAPRRSLQTKSSKVLAAGSGGLSSGAVSSSESHSSSDASQTMRRKQRQLQADQPVASIRRSVGRSSEELPKHLYLQQQQQQLSMSPKQLVEVSSQSSLINKSTAAEQQAANSFLLSKYYYA